jgi:hypothetical protein
MQMIDSIIVYQYFHAPVKKVIGSKNTYIYSHSKTTGTGFGKDGRILDLKSEGDLMKILYL